MDVSYMTSMPDLFYTSRDTVIEWVSSTITAVWATLCDWFHVMVLYIVDRMANLFVYLRQCRVPLHPDTIRLIQLYFFMSVGVIVDFFIELGDGIARFVESIQSLSPYHHILVPIGLSLFIVFYVLPWLQQRE